MMNDILFSIPSQFLSGIADGSLVRIGALIKHVGTGHVLGHLQETGLAQQLLGGLSVAPFTPLGAAASVIDAASSVYGNVQLSQIKSMMETMQTLQYANLGIALAGIGISVIGFSIISKKLNGIETQLMKVSKQIDIQFSMLYERDLRAHYSQMTALFEKAELAHSLSTPNREWLNIASQLFDQSSFFAGEIKHLLAGNVFDEKLFVALFQSMTLCNAGQIECLLLANEMQSAYKAAELRGVKYKALFDPLMPHNLANKVNIANKEKTYRREVEIKMINIIKGLRDITDMSLTKPILIERMIENKVGGREYLNAVRNDNNNSILLYN